MSDSGASGGAARASGGGSPKRCASAFSGVFLASAQTASQFAVSGVSVARVRHGSEAVDIEHGQRVADAGDPAVWAADHGQSFEREGGPGTVSQQVFEALKIARHVAVDECDPDTCIDRKPAVLPGEHVGGGRGVDEARTPEPPDHAAADALGERGQIGLGDRPGRQERRRGVAPCFGSRLHEVTVGHACVQVHE